MTNRILRLIAEQKAQVGEEVIVWTRLGDFYEVFGEDARICARELDLTLTSRETLTVKERSMPASIKANGQRVPMAGVPAHTIERYIGKLVKKGYRTCTLAPEETA